MTNKDSKLLLGSFIPMKKSTNYLLGTIAEAQVEGANCFMFYTGPPQTTKRTPIEELKVVEFHHQAEMVGIDLNTLAIHAPYVVNMANSINPSTFTFGVDFLIQELKRAAQIGVKIVVVHPGAGVGASLEQSLNQLVKGLNQVIAQKPQGVKIALETMSGKGSEVGVNFDQLAYLIDHVDNNQDLGVCFDTCHLYDSGYDIKNQWDAVKQEFNQKIGLDKLYCIHLNDSKFGLNSHKDRHANIGYGMLGFAALDKIVHDPELILVPKYLETPWIAEIPPYKEEIAMLKNHQFFDFISQIENQN